MVDARGVALITGLCNRFNYLYYLKAKLASLELLVEERTPTEPEAPSLTADDDSTQNATEYIGTVYTCKTT